MFILLDNADKSRDNMLASHITALHTEQTINQERDVYSEAELRQFISLARSFNPVIKVEDH